MSERPLFPLSAREKALVTSQLAAAAERGEELGAALRRLAEFDFASGTCRRHCALLAASLAAGDPLSTALSALPRSFAPDEVALVAAGEASGGDPTTTLRAWMVLAEERRRRRMAMASALTYPAVVFACLAFGLGVMLWKVVPTFATLHVDVGRELPLATTVLLATIEAIRGVLDYFIVAMPLLVLFAWLLWKLGTVRLLAHRVILAIPLAGAILRSRARCATLAVVAAFVSAGRGLSEALRQAALAQRNTWIAHDLAAHARRLDAGETIGLEPGVVFDRVGMHALRSALAARDPGAAVSRLALREASALSRQSARWRSLAPSVGVILIAVPVALALVGLYSTIFNLPALVP